MAASHKTYTLEQIKTILADSPKESVKVAVTDMDGVLRGKYVHKEKFLSALESGFGFCDVVFGWDMSDVLYDNVKYTGWHTGYPDAQCQVDVNTFRQIPWEDNTPFFLGDFRNQNGQALSICPRNVLKKVIKHCESLGFAPKFAMEFEFFIFAETPQSLREKKFLDLQPLTPGMFGYSILRSSQMQPLVRDLMDACHKFGIPLEGFHTETGPGVYEAAIMYDDALTMADRAVLFKSTMKEIGFKHGVTPCFMAKINPNLPGCSGHVHQSLNKNGTNVFYEAQDPHKMSALFKNYVAGQLALMPEFLPLFAPTINSYKRLVEGAWAPTTATWGVENRTTSLRIIPGSVKSTRLETRVVGSDVNPYLAIAGALSSGLYGIENKLALNQSATKGNAYEQSDAVKLPRNLQEAALKFQKSEIAKNYLGVEFVEHFANTRLWEWRQFNKAVTNWELERYVEII